jgi:transcriptional regulator GlxA family with amidase domain
MNDRVLAMARQCAYIEQMRQPGKTLKGKSRDRQAGSSPSTQWDSPKTASRAVVERLDATEAPSLAAGQRTSHFELRVGILLWPGFPLLSLAGLCDGLRHAADVGDASQQVRCAWSILGIPGDHVTASCGVRVPVDKAFFSDDEYDYIAVVGGLLPRINDADPRYVAFLRHANQMNVPLIGVCTGSFVLAKFGLLNDHIPCIHPFHVDDWVTNHPNLPFQTNTHYSISAKRMTCAGGTSIVELVSELVHAHCGPDRAAKVVHQMTVNAERTVNHVARRHALGYESQDREKLRRAVVLMEKNIATPLEIGVVAKQVDCSTRQLERIFLAETGLNPSTYYRHARLQFACWLLTTTDMPVFSIAYECGFSDASHFIRQFQQRYGLAPGRMRKEIQTPPERPSPHVLV